MVQRSNTYGQKNYNLNSDLSNAQDNDEVDFGAAYSLFYSQKDYEALLPESFKVLVDCFIDSGYLDDSANEIAYGLINEGNDWSIYQILGTYIPKDDAGIDLKGNYELVQQNSDFIKLCKYYFDEVFYYTKALYYGKDIYKDEDIGTFNDNFIDENGKFDFIKFCNETWFENDVMREIDDAVLDSDAVFNHIDEIRESYKEDEQEYYENKYKNYSKDELMKALDDDNRAYIYLPYFENDIVMQEISGSVIDRDIEAIRKALKRVNGEE